MTAKSVVFCKFGVSRLCRWLLFSRACHAINFENVLLGKDCSPAEKVKFATVFTLCSVFLPIYPSWNQVSVA